MAARRLNLGRPEHQARARKPPSQHRPGQAMQLPPLPHRWNVTPQQAVRTQRALASRVVVAAYDAPLRYVAGIDAAFTPGGTRCLAGIVVWDLRESRVSETRIASRKLSMPYIPGLLSFREGPAIVAALRELVLRPDLLMFDGHGLAHPRRLGIASHIGVVTGLPSLGCAKRRLVGAYRDPGSRRGARTALYDGTERIGTVLRTRDGVKPVFVSVGHKVDLATAERAVLRTGAGFRLPEPIRLADRLVTEARRPSRR